MIRQRGCGVRTFEPEAICSATGGGTNGFRRPGPERGLEAGQGDLHPIEEAERAENRSGPSEYRADALEKRK
jgi:hypothetical protein